MNSGFVLGSAAALSWGVADVLVTRYSRQVGWLRGLFVIHALSLIGLVALAFTQGLPDSASTSQWLAAAALGPLAVLGYAGFYKALELGPISIVSPIVSAFGAVVVLLALIVLGQTLSTLQAVGCVLVIGFLVLASIETTGSSHLGGAGIRLSLMALIAFGVYLFLQGELAGDLGWLYPILVSRVVAVAILAVMVARTPGDGRSLTRTAVVGCFVAGSLDAAAFLFFNRGAEIGELAITGAAASAYPLIPIVVGLFALRERVATHQLVGVGGVIAGMVVLSLG